jgi:hypothetical protein
MTVDVPTVALFRDHCKLGCICDSIRMRPIPPSHCGKVECMFECG